MEILLALGAVIFAALLAAMRSIKETPAPAPEPVPEAKNEPSKPIPAPVPVTVPEAESLKWDTVTNSRKSVRIICDQEGLTVTQKNELCATVGAESGWQSYYLSGKKRGQPVKLENKGKDGKVWSTDWGIIQCNDWYHIGPGKSFPSVEFVLNNPEACIRWMAKNWKAGRAHWWIAYKSGLYKQYLKYPQA